MIFPTLRGKRAGYLNLDTCAQQWLGRNKAGDSCKNPLLHPTICQSMVSEYHELYGLDWSYGGWMENRSVLWRGSYLDKTGHLHLGVDLNAPVGTPVALDQDAFVHLIDDDTPEEFGWGERIVVKIPSKKIYLIYAHISVRLYSRGDFLQAGRILGDIAEPSRNGGWYPHVHVQVIPFKDMRPFYASMERLDGYGDDEDVKILSQKFPDPLQWIQLS